MDIFLDDRRIEADTSGRSLGDVLKQMQADLAPSDRIVVGVYCDGIDVAVEEFEAQLDQPIRIFDRVEFKSADPRLLVSEALESAAQLLTDSEQGAEEVVNLLGAGQTEAALNRLGNCCQSWIQIHQGICQSIAMLKLDAASFEANGKSLEVLLGGPIEHLGQIKKAVEARDFVTLADMLSYEFPDSIQDWRSIVTELQSVVQLPATDPASSAI